MTIQAQLLLAVLAPLVGAIIAGLLGKKLGKVTTHRVTILGVLVSFVIAVKWFFVFLWGDATAVDLTVYEWASFGDVTIQIGFMLDSLTAIMMLVVTFVSLMVHIYSIGYMHDDLGYQRFFSYISLFTFSMLMLVMSNNFLQLFFGWEAVGVVSYLLIGFWYQKDSAIFANMKAFLVNRVGDFGFILGIGGIFLLFGTFDYAPIFTTMGVAQELVSLGGQPQENALALMDLNKTFAVWGDIEWAAMSFICICLFIGAMGKSAQVPLHIWLPDSMEGPTPISALIHAATMVTAGVFMVARMSPLFEFSETALAMITVIGAITALFMGLVAIVQNDIKRIIAYSTLSQLGYMVVALGVSAYSAAIFHLFTHAFFKALLFLGAGSVIIALHHEQDIRKMGGLYKKLPITYWCTLIGTLALIGTPFFSGFYSKDTIISASAEASGGFSGFAYFAVLTGVVVTAIYSVRLLLIVFHGKTRTEEKQFQQIQESPRVITWPLIALAIPSLFAGFVFGKPLLFGSFFRDSISVLEEHNVLQAVEAHYTSAIDFALHGFTSPVFLMLILGIVIAVIVYGWAPRFITMWAIFLKPVKKLLEKKYFFDDLNEKVVARSGRWLGQVFWRYGDKAIIDEGIIDGGTNTVKSIASKIRKIQTGYLYHYALMMVIGLVALLMWLLFKG
ncbi:NADH-quinone oxidoreductase subunit L [Kangiella spongicola]|uniref:NADH-quinone oxidoreductase subunit L n=1 Tax=Kangiella spongicola TaxID=796379 RepID=A0A318DBC6_9GAMM|nr:NADH-quinone oxidoreductase subunit L [Kangiella spongicola]PXF64524.1 NADH-quinone oxidoreductase subunit L [Kangiella spongicola]